MVFSSREQKIIGKLNEKERMNLESFSVPSYVDFYNKGRFLGVEEHLAKDWLAGQRMRVLDIACGTGRTSIALKKLGHEVVGIDIAPAMIEVAKRQYPDIEFSVMDACELEFPDGSFDAAYISWNGIDCIYPIERRWQALREAVRVVKPGGLLVYSSHNWLTWPLNRYGWFWWFINIVTGRIFTPYKLEYKGFRAGIKLILFGRRISRTIEETKRFGLKFLNVYPEIHLPWAKRRFSDTKDLRPIDIFATWAYMVFRKE